jgi:hypothetical protein
VWWKALLSKQDENILIEKERAPMKRRKKDFMLLIVGTS